MHPMSSAVLYMKTPVCMHLKLGINLTCSRISKLSTNNLCIHVTPEIITDCSPDRVVADLHTSLRSSTSSKQSNVSFSTLSFTTYDTSIFAVCTVVVWVEGAIEEERLIPNAVNIIDVYLSSALSKIRLFQCLDSCNQRNNTVVILCLWSANHCTMQCISKTTSNTKEVHQT